MVKRIEEISTCYKIACSQVYFPNDVVNTLINFHVGCASAQKEDFLSCANSIVSEANNCAIIVGYFQKILLKELNVLIPFYVFRANSFGILH